jgi:hypothetical protein
MDPEMARMLQQRTPPSPYTTVEQLLRQEKFDVVPTSFTAHEPVPDEYDALVVIGPSRWDERAQWELNRALVSGKPVLLAVQHYTWNYGRDPRTGGTQLRWQDAEVNIDPVLDAQGLSVSKDFLMDEEHETLMAGQAGFVKAPIHVVVRSESIAAGSPLTAGLQSLFYLWGTAVTVDEGRLSANGLRREVLFCSSTRAWTVPPKKDNAMFSPRGRALTQFPLALDVKGTFADAFAGKPRPKWTFKLELGPDGRPRPAPADGPETPYASAPGRLIVTGCARMWSNPFLGTFGDGTFLLNCIDTLTQDEDLLSVRAKQPAPRMLSKPSEGDLLLFRWIPLGLVPLLVIASGVGIWLLRVRRRERWMEAHGR